MVLGSSIGSKNFWWQIFALRDRVLLFDLSVDPGEQEDLSDQMPELVQVMQVGQKQKGMLKKVEWSFIKVSKKQIHGLFDEFHCAMDYAQLLDKIELLCKKARSSESNFWADGVC